MTEKIAEIDTNRLVIISELLSPINFPKNPEIIEAIQSSGKLDDDKEKLLIELITKLKGTLKS